MGQLVGRGAEVSTLSGLLDEAADGHPRALVVHGEAGVGKTRMVREVLAARGDACVLWGTCVHFGASTLDIGARGVRDGEYKEVVGTNDNVLDVGVGWAAPAPTCGR